MSIPHPLHVPSVLDYHERTKLPPENDGVEPGRQGKAVPFVRYAGSTRVLLERPASLVSRRVRRTDPLAPEPFVPSDFGDPTLAAPDFDRLFGAARQARPAEVDARSTSLLLVDAAGLSARQRGPRRWRRRLRVVPARNDVPAVSTYLLASPHVGLEPMAGLYHYAPLRHELERRYLLSDGEWWELTEGLPGRELLLGFGVIPARLRSVAGERAFRDAHLELGHTLAAAAYSAACLGWRAHQLDGLSDAVVEQLLASDPEGGELPGPLLSIATRPLGLPTAGDEGKIPERLAEQQRAASYRLPERALDLLSMVETEGSSNLGIASAASVRVRADEDPADALADGLAGDDFAAEEFGSEDFASEDFDRVESADLQLVEIGIDPLGSASNAPSRATAPAFDPRPLAAAMAYGGEGETRQELEGDPAMVPSMPEKNIGSAGEDDPERSRSTARKSVRESTLASELDAELDARAVIRARRSARSMDTRFGIDRHTFSRLMGSLVPARSAFPWVEVLPWRPRVAALVFVHRVAGLEPGLYLVDRHPDQVPSLHASARRDGLLWQEVPGATGLPLTLLRPADGRESAEMVCAGQEQAADGAFTVVFLAEMEPALRWHGPWFYSRLLWEAGAAAQVLALEATSLDLAATPMGRFHDELAHLLLGFEDRTWQAIYAVAVGVGIEDPRLETYPPY